MINPEEFSIGRGTHYLERKNRQEYIQHLRNYISKKSEMKYLKCWEKKTSTQNSVRCEIILQKWRKTDFLKQKLREVVNSSPALPEMLSSLERIKKNRSKSHIYIKKGRIKEETFHFSFIFLILNSNLFKILAQCIRLCICYTWLYMLIHMK